MNDEPSTVEAPSRGVSPDVQGKQGFTGHHLASEQFSGATASRCLTPARSTTRETRRERDPPRCGLTSNGRGDLIRLLRPHGAHARHANTIGQPPARLARLIGSYDVARNFEDMAECARAHHGLTALLMGVLTGAVTHGASLAPAGMSSPSSAWIGYPLQLRSGRPTFGSLPPVPPAVSALHPSPTSRRPVTNHQRLLNSCLHKPSFSPDSAARMLRSSVGEKGR